MSRFSNFPADKTVGAKDSSLMKTPKREKLRFCQTGPALTNPLDSESELSSPN